jgi:hypothetical protein
VSHFVGNHIIECSVRFHVSKIGSVELHIAGGGQEGGIACVLRTQAVRTRLAENIAHSIDLCSLGSNAKIVDGFAAHHHVRQITDDRMCPSIGRPAWSRSTTSVARASNGSRKARARSSGTRLSCRTFAANAVRLQLHALAYNLGNFWRTLATPEPIKDWSLTSLKERLIKIGAKVVSHGRYVVFQMAEVAIARQMFQGSSRNCGRSHHQR